MGFHGASVMGHWVSDTITSEAGEMDCFLGIVNYFPRKCHHLLQDCNSYLFCPPILKSPWNTD